MEESEIKARMTIEALGSPPEALSNALKAIIGGINNRKQVEVTKEDYGKPEKIKNSFLHSGFVEFECNIKNFQSFLGLLMDFQPSVVEVLEPDEISMPVEQLQPILNDLLAKLKKYDSKVKSLVSANIILKKELANEKQK